MATTGVAAGPRVGDMLPDFTVRTVAGRTIHRRDFKGRRHLIVCFADPRAADGGAGLLAALAGAYEAYRAERADLLLVVDGAPPPAALAAPFPVIVDADGDLRGRFGAPSAALVIADRYGQIMVREDRPEPAADGAGPGGLPLETIPAALGWLETRCSL